MLAASKLSCHDVSVVVVGRLLNHPLLGRAAIDCTQHTGGVPVRMKLTYCGSQFMAKLGADM